MGQHKALTSLVDELGEVARVQVDTSVYSKSAIFKTCYWLTEKYFFFLSSPSTNLIDVEIRAKDETTQDEIENLCREFCNSLIDQQVRQNVISETGAVRDALIKKAFFEGEKHIDPDLIISNEVNIPGPHQSYVNDPLRISKTTGSD